MEILYVFSNNITLGSNENVHVNCSIYFLGKCAENVLGHILENLRIYRALMQSKINKTHIMHKEQF